MMANNLEITKNNETAETAKKVWVIINPFSGNKKYKNKEKELKQAFERYKLLPQFIKLDEIKNGFFNEDKLAELHAVIVVGGDGTVRSVASHLVGKNIPLGIIPGGTFNHLAKDLKLPQDLDDCLDIIAHRHIQMIDVAEVNGYYFLNNASIGLYPKAVRYRRMYSNILKWLAMSLALLNIFKEFPTFKVNYRFKDKDFEVITPLVFISNNLYFLDLLRLTERKKLNAGKLYLYINHCRSRLKFLMLLFNILLHKRKKTEGLFDIQAVEECILILKKSVVDVAMDGELVRLTPPLHFRIHKKQLPIISPENQD